MINQQAIADIKKLLMQNFPDYIDKIILFGSRVKGEARVYSDYDILIILKKSYDWKLKNKIHDKIYDIDLKYDIFTDLKLISKNELKTFKGKQPFILEALENGIVL